jgi:hypothetical protein
LEFRNPVAPAARPIGLTRLEGRRWTDEAVPQMSRAKRNPTAAPTVIAATAIMTVVILRHAETPGATKAAAQPGV